MISPLMIGLWIGGLSFVFVFSTLMDFLLVDKSANTIVVPKQVLTLEEKESEEEDGSISSYLDHTYEDVAIIDED